MRVCIFFYSLQDLFYLRIYILIGIQESSTIIIDQAILDVNISQKLIKRLKRFGCNLKEGDSSFRIFGLDKYNPELKQFFLEILRSLILHKLHKLLLWGGQDMITHHLFLYFHIQSRQRVLILQVRKL